MNRETALAKIAEIMDTPTTRERIWDALSAPQRRAIARVAGVQSVDIEARHMHPADFAACWLTLDRLTVLASRITAANDAQRITAQVQHNAIVNSEAA